MFPESAIVTHLYSGGTTKFARAFPGAFPTDTRHHACVLDRDDVRQPTHVQPILVSVHPRKQPHLLIRMLIPDRLGPHQFFDHGLALNVLIKHRGPSRRDNVGGPSHHALEFFL